MEPVTRADHVRIGMHSCSVYMVYNEQPGEATGTLLGQSIINAIVIVCAICAVTFVLVLCYKYRCIKVRRRLAPHVARHCRAPPNPLPHRPACVCGVALASQCMIGYLIFASASLLGYSGGFVVMTAFEVYRVMISWPTFIFLMYNFAIVGVVAVFWQKVRHRGRQHRASPTAACAALRVGVRACE